MGAFSEEQTQDPQSADITNRVNEFVGKVNELQKEYQVQLKAQIHADGPFVNVVDTKYAQENQSTNTDGGVSEEDTDGGAGEHQ